MRVKSWSKDGDDSNSTTTTDSGGGDDATVPLLGQHLRVTVCANQGGRKYMEDRVHIHCERSKVDNSLLYTFVAVYDGHGGSEAAEYARKHLLWNITDNQLFESNRDEDVLEAIREGFLKTHYDMWKIVDQWPRTASGFTSTAGTTASIAFIMRGKVYSGHVGDSAIVLGTETSTGCLRGDRITVDHKPDEPMELKRICGAGGEVRNKAGVMRVVWTRPVRGHVGPVRRSTPQEKIPFLAVARALGDLWSYNTDEDKFVVSPDPDVEVLTLTGDDRCLVLGSDGLTNVIRAQHSIDIVNYHEWKEAKERGLDLLKRPTHSNHAKLLVRSGLRGWGCLRADNITVITVIFDAATATLPDDHDCVSEVLSCSSAVDEHLTEQPDMMLRIAPPTVQLLKTAPVELLYTGAKDPPLIDGSVTLDFRGPGFVPAVGQRALFSTDSSNTAPTVPKAMTPKPTNGVHTVILSNGVGPKSCNDVTSRSAKQEEEQRPRKWGGNYKPVSGSSSLITAQNGQSPNSLLKKSKVADGCQSARSLMSTLSMSGKRTFYCADHGVTCARAKEQNQLQDKDAVGSTPKAAGSPSSASRLKYYCRKHGLSCAKVKKMNSDYNSSLDTAKTDKPVLSAMKRPASGISSLPSPSTLTKTTVDVPPTATSPPLSAIPSTNASSSPVSTDSTNKKPAVKSITPRGPRRMSLPAKIHNTRFSHRVTRSGKCFPSSAVSKSTSNVRRRSLRRVIGGVSTSIISATPERDLPARRATPAGVRAKRLIFGRRKKRLSTSALLQSSSSESALPQEQGGSSGAPSRPSSSCASFPATHGSRIMSRRSTTSLDKPLCVDTNDSYAAAMTTLNGCSKFLNGSISPRHLARNPIHQLPPPSADDHFGASLDDQTRRLPKSVSESYCALKRTHENLDTDGPATKKSRLWNLFSFIAGGKQ